MKIFDSELIRLAAGFSVLAGVVAAGIQVNRNLAELPVEQAAVVSSAAPVPAPKPLYTVAVEGPAKRIPKVPQDTSGVDVEAVFRGDAEQQEEDAKPDYAQMARTAIRIDGVTDGGIIVGGKFFAVGSAVPIAPAGLDAAPLESRLVAVRQDRLVFSINGQGLILERGEGGWH